MGVAVLFAWFLLRPGEPERADETPVEEAAPPPAPLPPPPAPPLQPAVKADAAAPTTADDHGELPHAHPITTGHQRIQLQNQFIQVLNDAMDLRDGPRLRELATRYREQGFEDVDKLGDGYEIVASCLEHPGPASREAAQVFFDRERGSIIRRHVKRHCLEAPVAAPSP